MAKPGFRLGLRGSLCVPGPSPRMKWLLRTTPGMAGNPGPGSTTVKDFHLGMYVIGNLSKPESFLENSSVVHAIIGADLM